MLGQDFIKDGSTILTHGSSRVVVALLKLAAANGKHFSVICTGACSACAELSPIYCSFLCAYWQTSYALSTLQQAQHNARLRGIGQFQSPFLSQSGSAKL